MEFFTKFNPPPKKGMAFVEEFGNPECKANSKTKQEFKSECDLNAMIKRAKASGSALMSPYAKDPAKAMYGDFADFADKDLQAMQNDLIAAEKAFLAIPSAIREEFGNDPAKLVSAFGDPSKREKLERLGLVEKKAVAIPPVDRDQQTDEEPSRA